MYGFVAADSAMFSARDPLGPGYTTSPQNFYAIVVHRALWSEGALVFTSGATPSSLRSRRGSFTAFAGQLLQYNYSAVYVVHMTFLQ